MEEIQQLVDRLGRELSRGIVIDDRRFRLIAHSAHQNTTDRARNEAILHRECPRPVREWLLGLGVEDAQDWQRIPANPDLGMAPRVYVPVRSEGELLAHVWIIEEQAMTQKELRTARRAADTAADMLFRLRMRQQVDQGLEREGVRDLLDDSLAVREQAAAQLVEAELFRSATQVCALVCTPAPPGAVLDDTERVNLDSALYQVRMSLSRRDMIYLIRPDHAVALFAVSEPRLPASALTETANLVRSRLDGIFGGDGDPGPVLALGSLRPSLADARKSYDQALRAARIAHAFPSTGNVVSWDELGVYRLLSQFALSELAQAELDDRILHPGVVAILQGRHGAARLRLLELYLDSGGDAAATAAQLQIHRGSVYYRLGRMEEDMGISLSNGLERLAVHMSVKLIRLCGLEMSSTPPSAA